MQERMLSIPTASGAMETFVTHPDEGGPFAPVILFMDVWGLREELFDVARRIATVGYYVAVPDQYYRLGRVRHQWRDANGRMISLKLLDDARQREVLDPLQRTSDQMVIDATRDLLAYLDANEPIRKGGPVGSVGYCMGGRHIMRVAAAFPGRFRASAGLHSSDVVTDSPDSPHLDVRRAAGELYMGHAEHDHYSTPERMAAIAKSLEGANVRYIPQFHPGADHGYALPDRDVHHKTAANRDWEVIFAMFRRQLGPLHM